jgi:hypothetical protein
LPEVALTGAENPESENERNSTAIRTDFKYVGDMILLVGLRLETQILGKRKRADSGFRPMSFLQVPAGTAAVNALVGQPPYLPLFK